jgi:PPP family 3-phenylpropionic acid transporter
MFRINSQSRFALFFFFYYGYLGIVSPYLSLYFDAIGFTAIQISLLMSMLQITRIMGPFAWGWLADFRQDRIGIMRVTAVISLILFTGIFYLQSFWPILLWMFLLNTFSSSLTPLGEAATLHALQKENAFESRYGKLRLWGSIGFMFAVFAGGYWFESQGISSLTWVGWILLACVTLCTWILWEPPMTGQPLSSGQMRHIIKRPEVLWFFSSTFWMIFAHASLYVFYSLYLVKLGYGKEMIGFFWLIGVGAEVIYFYFQKRVYLKMSARRIIEISFLIGIVRFVVIAYVPAFWPLLIVQIYHAATFAAHHSASIQLMLTWFQGPTQARGQALYTTVAYGLGGSIGGVVAGWVWDSFGPAHAFGLSAVACIFGYFSIRQSSRTATTTAATTTAATTTAATTSSASGVLDKK